jgi:anti-anti-sigma regulatory factor
MRRSGLLDTSQRFGPSDHACWAYETHSERAAAAVAWLADGLALGQRAMYIADAPAEVLISELADLSDRDEAIARGALVVAETRSNYDLSAPIDANVQLAVYNSAVERAIADGYSGLRVAADITLLVEDPARRQAHLHWEQCADRYMTEQPLAPLCLYDRRRVGGFQAVEHVHPLAGPDMLPFSLYGVGRTRSALDGEVDALIVEPFTEAMTTLPDDDDTIVFSGLRFVDAHAAWVLHQTLERRRAAGRPLALHDPPPLVRRVWTLCGFDPTLLEGAG